MLDRVKFELELANVLVIDNGLEQELASFVSDHIMPQV